MSTSSPSPIDNFAATAELVTAQLGQLAQNNGVMQLATPCEGWAVQDLVEHLVDNSYFFAGAAGSDQTRSEDIGPSNAPQAYRSAADTVLGAYGTPGTLERDLSTPFGSFPGAIVLSVAFADQLTHLWDLGHALGNQPVVDETLASSAIAAWEMFIQPELRDGSTFAQPTEVGPNATPLDRVAAFTGRAV